jgi:gluconolactonase
MVSTLMKTLSAAIGIILLCTSLGGASSGTLFGAELPTAEQVTPHEVVRTGDYSEGVVVDHDGNLYFSHNGVVTKVAPDGKATEWARTGNPNGHKILGDGTHLICDAGHHAILHVDANGR